MRLYEYSEYEHFFNTAQARPQAMNTCTYWDITANQTYSSIFTSSCLLTIHPNKSYFDLNI